MDRLFLASKFSDVGRQEAFSADLNCIHYSSWTISVRCLITSKLRMWAVALPPLLPLLARIRASVCLLPSHLPVSVETNKHRCAIASTLYRDTKAPGVGRRFGPLAPARSLGCQSMLWMCCTSYVCICTRLETLSQSLPTAAMKIFA